MASKKQSSAGYIAASSPWDDADVLSALEDMFRLTCHVCGCDEMEILNRCPGCARMVCDDDSDRVDGLDGEVVLCRGCIAACDVSVLQGPME